LALRYFGGYPHKNQRGLELKIILSIENDEEPEIKYVNILEKYQIIMINHLFCLSLKTKAKKSGQAKESD